MLTRFVRIQLAIFTIVGIIGLFVMVVFYIQAPTLLGIGKMTVTLDLPATGGLYRFSNVTYRGVQIGKVTSVDLAPHGAKATLSLDTSPKIPADLQARGAQHLSGGRAVRGFAAPNQLGALPARRFGYRRERYDHPAADRSRAGPDQQVAHQHPQGQAQRFARRVLQGIQRGRLRLPVAVRLVGESFGRPERRRRPNASPDRGHWAVPGQPGADHRLDPTVGPQPCRVHRAIARPTILRCAPCCKKAPGH